MYMQILDSFIDQLNTCVHATMKATPFELMYGQPPRTTVFPGETGHALEEDVEDLLDEGKCDSIAVKFLLCAHSITKKVVYITHNRHPFWSRSASFLLSSSDVPGFFPPV